MPHSIDALDARLLDTMRAHPRVGLTELARLLGVARGTVQARLDKLVAREVIATILTSPAVQRSDTSVALSTQIPYRVEPLIRAAPR
jgi:DNA-binding MarR family transcriptional regulator